MTKSGMDALATIGVILGLCGPHRAAGACTNFLVTKGASADGSTMITYSADSHTLYGELYFRPARKYPPGATMKVHDWDTGKYLGLIKQARRTFRVVGNMNEHQVVIGETTYGGRTELKNPKGGIDYGSMMYVALQRARTAREAIRIMTELAAEYGYYSEGESFSIADPNEVWMMDLIGKGPSGKGAVWVACKIPDGYVTAHANQPRIRTFPQNDPEKCIYSKDVISFARKKGYFKGKDRDFSFHDAYAPPKCRDKRIRDARVWSFYRRVAPSLGIPIDYVKCKKGANPLPLWIKPDKKLSARDLTRLMRDHFEDSEFDLRKDVGAGPFALPYRWRPLTWKVGGNTYLNERATSTQQTGFSFVSQSRAWLPNPVGGLLWFSVDDSASAVYIPIYVGITKVPRPYAVGTGSFNKFSWESAFWVFNLVSNWAYTRYQDIIKDIRKVQTEFENRFFEEQPKIEKQATALHKQSPAGAETLLTRYSVKAGETVVARWRRLHIELFMKYMDGNVRNGKGKVLHPPYPDQWYRRIVKETGEHFLVERADGGVPKPDQPPTGPPGSAAPPDAPGARPAGKQAPAPAGAKKCPSPPRSGCGCKAAQARSPIHAGWYLVLLLVVGWIGRRGRSPGSRNGSSIEKRGSDHGRQKDA